jgi:6-phosphofructokinase 2
MTPAPAVDIVTFTPNPALDITTSVERVLPTHKMRCGPARYDPGGGGVNVARVAHVLGVSVNAVFPAGGATGDALVTLLDAEAVRHQRIRIAAPTRESFTVNEETSRRQYRFVLPGPVLTDSEHSECLHRLRDAAAQARYVVASGSLPPGTPADCYQRVASDCATLGRALILDTSGAGLHGVRSGVFLLKPSVGELAECVGSDLSTEDEQDRAARTLIERGVARNVLVSLGPDGAVLVTPTATFRYRAPVIAEGSGVGAGDALVAGLTCGLVWGWPLPHAVRLGMAAGAAMLLTPGTAVCSEVEVRRLFGMVAEPSPSQALQSHHGIGGTR